MMTLTILERRIIEALSKGPKTRDQLVKKLKIPRTTIFDSLRKLIKKEIVERKPMNSGKSPKWCSNSEKCNRNYYISNVCGGCKKFSKLDGSPPLQGKKGAPKMLFSLKKSE